MTPNRRTASADPSMVHTCYFATHHQNTIRILQLNNSFLSSPATRNNHKLNIAKVSFQTQKFLILLS